VGYAVFCRFALGVPMPSMAPRPGARGGGLRVEADLGMPFYSNRTAMAMSGLFALSGRLGKWARILVQNVLYALGLDYRHGSVAGWSKAIASDEATGLIYGWSRKCCRKFRNCQHVVTLERRR
jgi:hypothetical protein